MIGKRRQATGIHDADAGPARGILRRSLPPGAYSNTRHTPSEPLRPWIQHFWTVAWNLAPGVCHTVETLPHPNVHLVFTGGDEQSVLIHGIHTARFTRQLAGSVRVFGVKFRPGAFHHFLGAPVATLRSKTIPASHVFGDALRFLTPLLASSASPQEIGRAHV